MQPDPAMLKQLTRYHALIAARDGSPTSLQHYLEVGADANAQDDQGMTALHHAVAIGSRECVRILVNSGKCSYLIRDKLGRYASEIALEWGLDAAVAALLAKKQAQEAAKKGVPAWEKSSL
ncbi:ankyrin repeat protein [Caballeronia udeis]|uniref:Ankyrin repeat protein n=1 Tax=Caballeronia udeis TaxID=1232866 RepID=A0ABW8MNI7_9BURK